MPKMPIPSLDDFSSPYFKPEGHVRMVCSRDATVDDLNEHRDKVQTLGEKVSQEMRANVYKHYVHYIETSKEIAKLEADMHELAALLNTEKDIIAGMGHLSKTGELPGFGLQKTVALVNVYGVNMVDPLLRGELLFHGTLLMVEEGKQKKNTEVHVFLLPQVVVLAAWVDKANLDLDLITTEHLEDVQVEDLPEGRDIPYCFKLEGVERYVLQCTSTPEKQGWLRSLRRTIATCKGRGAKEAAAEAAEQVQDQQDRSMELRESWLSDSPEDLDVYVAQRAFGDAVDLYDKATAELAEYPASKVKSALEAALKARLGVLTQALCTEISRPTLRIQSLRATVLLLLRLGENERACERYLESWSNTIVRDFQKLKMEGSTELFIHKLTRVFFASIHTTCGEFSYLFNDSAKSAYVAWVEKELEAFSNFFSKQVFQSTTTSFGVMGDCAAVAFESCKRLLDDGLDVEFILWRCLTPSCIAAIDNAGQVWMSSTAHNIVDDLWGGQEFTGKQLRKSFVEQLSNCKVRNPEDYMEGMVTHLFTSVSAFCVSTHAFVKAAALVFSQTTQDYIVDWVAKLFNLMMQKLSQYYDGREQFKTNAVFLLDEVLPEAVRILNEKHSGNLPALDTLSASLEQQWATATSEEGISYS